MRSRTRRVAVAITLLVGMTAAPSTPALATSAPSAKPTGEITVFAASSLTEAFTSIGRSFERHYPDTQVVFSFNASSSLSAQIQAGAPADVFASADESDVEEIVTAVKGDASIFARNRLVIAVEPGNPLGIRGVIDTIDEDLLLVLCVAEAPCGSLARRVYRRAGVAVPDAASAENVKAALTTVVLGEADAAVVYSTDVQASDGAVDSVRIPRRENVIARYPIAALKDSGNPRLAQAFVRFVRSADGQRVLRDLGFLAP